MQNQNLPIGSAGCTLTSFAMILNYLTGSGNPKDVNTRMGIYACYNGSPRGFGFAKAAEYYNLSIIYSNTSIVDSDFVTSQVVQYISQGYPLLVGLENTQGNTHYVTVTGYSRSESNFIYTIKINDPGYSRSVLSEYFDLGYQVYRIYVYKKN